MAAPADPARVGRARKGDAAAFEALVEARIGPLARTALAILGREDESLDAAQDALVIAWRELASLRDPAAFDAWLARILVSRCKRGQRRIVPQRADAPGAGGSGVTAGGSAGDAPAAGGGRLDALERAFGRLTVDERALLVLRHLDARPTDEIAAVLRVRVEAVPGRLLAARQALEAGLEPGGDAAPPGAEPPATGDDTLVAMLRERAGRLPPAAVPAISGRLHDALRTHRPGGILAFLPLGDRAGAMSGWAGWAAALATAVVVLAVLGGRPTGDPGTTAVPPAVSAPPSTPEAGSAARPLDRDEFAAAVLAGSLDGRLVLVDGALDGDAACGQADCDPLRLAGLDEIPVDWKGPAPAPEPGGAAASPAPGADDWRDGPFLVRPGDGRVELLGRLAGVLDSPASVQGALRDPRAYPNASSPFDILPVAGFLVGCQPTAGCAARGFALSNTLPGRMGPIGGGGRVDVLDPSLGTSGPVIERGPFLVRFQPVTASCARLAVCEQPGWGVNPTVIGSYQTGEVVRVRLQP